MTRLVARAPTRIDFGGGWTDVPPYCDREGGFVCNLAIDRYASASLARRVHGDDAHRSAAQDHRLIDAALRRAQLEDVAMQLGCDFPQGAGLGGSSAASAAILGAIASWQQQPIDPSAIAELGRKIEVEDLGIAGGRQDHYAATHGGALALEFTDTTRVRRIPLSARTRDSLERRCVLVYTGESRISGDTITAVLDAYEAKVPRVVSALARMKGLAEEMASALAMGAIDTLGALVGEHWTHQRALHPAIPTPRIDEILDRARHCGALGGKALGASGGGCVIVIAAEGREAEVRSAVASLGQLLPWHVDEAGLHVTAEAPLSQ
ncbi:MAG: kinase [Gemmatimonadetes bacterium]|nr:kinase [Gemmatimonadota bacterium]